MKKLLTLLLAVLFLTTAACTSSGATTSQPPTPSESSEPVGEPAADGPTYTGILEEDKGFMITVSDGSESYAFGTEGVTMDTKVGDKVKVTYTGDINEAGALLDATKVEVVE